MKQRSLKSGQRPFYDRTVRTAARVAGRRRARRPRGTGKRTWLQAWPRGSNQGNNGNAGKPPAYSTAAYNGSAWKKGKA